MRRHLSHLVEVSKIPYYSGGDADIYSKPGRTTGVRLKVDNLRVSNGKKYVIARVDCRIIEAARDYTHLRYFDQIRIPIPRGWRNRRIRIGNEVRELNVRFSVNGQRHDWIEIPVNDDETIVEDAWVRIDGRGDDDEGNARLALWLNVPLRIT